MNIFVLSHSPVWSARFHCDKHVPKMILETAQMMCTASNEYGLDSPYKSAYKNHPCTVWARESWDNWDWLFRLATTLNLHYKIRFGHDYNHKSYDAICEIDAIKLHSLMPKGFTPHPQCMPDKYKDQDPVIAYRNYYRGEKKYFAKWRLYTPVWWEESK